MTDIYGVMNLAGNALLAHQKAINVTGNNIANVNTPGYSRQKLLLETKSPMQSSIGLMGTGVEADSVERVYDRFLGVQINSESETLGRWAARKEGLELAEVIFDESGEFGLSQSLNEFWTSWQNLTNDPSGYNERVVLQAKSEVMTGSFNRLYADLQNAQQGFDASIEGAVADINRLSQQIAELNQNIMEVEASGSSANEYRDRRDLALKELAGLIDINTFEDGTGRVTVSVGSGQTLVESNSSRNLTTQVNGFGFKDVAWVGQDGTTVNITSNISNGKLNGWLQARDVDNRGYLRQLDILAESLMERVNNLHQGGWGLDGSNGNDFLTGLAAASGNLDSLLTITAEAGGTGNIGVTLVGGGTAGAETVTTDSVTGDIRIAIQDGASTGNQIALALEAHSGINTVVAASPAAAWDLSAGTNTTALGGGSSAEVIQVNAAISNNLDLIAASDASAGIPGNNGQAIAIANLQHSLTMNGSSSTFEDYYNSLVSKVGGDMQSAEAYFNHQSDMVVQLENRRESISGVSLDEEMINLIKFQTAYDAAAKLISTADEMLQTVLNMV
ncbi:MAG: flagellar hook-associated protein FlgK [Deltaproteobacteria bacterium]|nr:flagellar hook-associated protein FlgK [Deltaproteobacteria bacterium]